MRLKTTASLLALASSLGAIALPAAAQNTATPIDANTGPIQSETDAATTVRLKADRAEQESKNGGRPADDAGDIVVTGSRIVNPNLASAAPIQAVSAQEIKLSGAVNIEDVLNRLPQVVPYNPQADDEGNGTARVNLRNIGGSGGAALVLLDGQRLGGQLAADVNSIPPALVQRVDVLTGGAAAVYGPDALTGVVNFVLKKNFDGVQIDANYGFFNHINRRNIVTDVAQSRGFAVPLGQTNDGARATINVAAGKRFLNDRLSLTGYFSYRHTDNLPYTSRSTQACHLLQAGIDGALSCDTTLYSRNGYIYNLNGGTPQINAADGVSRNFRDFRNTQDATTDRQNRMDSSYQMLRANERYNAGGFLSFKATNWAELYGSFMYTKNTSQGTYNPATIFEGTNGDDGYQLNCNNPLMSAQQAQVLCGTQAGTAATVPIDFGYRFANFPTRTIDYRQVYDRATLGVRGDFGGAWHYDVGGVWAKSIATSAINRNWAPSGTNIAKALNVVSVNGVPTCVSKVNGSDPSCVPLDIFRGGSDDPAAYRYIFQYAPNGPTRNVTYFVDTLASISGNLGHYGIRSPLASDGVQINLSAEYRRDVANNFTSADYNSIIQGTDNPSSSSRGTQTAKELAAELQVPLVQDKSWTHLLGFSGGYRASNYDTSTKTFYGTWKLEGTWAPIKDVRFRVARNFASRAPNVFEATQSINYSRSLNFVDPCGRNPNGGAPLASLAACSLQPGFQPSTYGSASLQCPEAGCIYRNGAVDPALGPQTANTLTYGFVLTPRFLPRFTFSVDHYDIRYTNQIVALGQDDITNNCIAYASQQTDINRISCQQFIRNANGTLFGSIDNPNAGFLTSLVFNVPNKIGTTGYDFQSHYDVPVGTAGALALDFNGGIVSSAGSISNQSGNVGYFGTNVGNPIPKWRHNLRATFTGQDGLFQVSGNWRYVSATRSGDILLGKTQNTFARIPVYSYFDIAANINVAKRMTLGVTINNLLDKDPPIIPARGGNNSYSINGWQNSPVNFYDVYGRYIQFSATTRF